MPLIVIVGQPCSGKSTAAGLLARLFHNKGLDVTVIDEPSLHVDRNEGYKNVFNEKNTRSSVRAAVQRAVDRKRVVILDSLNNIKGYRYELWCAARTASSRYAMLHCDTVVDTCREWNKARAGDKYNDDIFEDLASRFERPDARNRWDSPLFTLRPTHDNGAEVLEQVVHAVTDDPANARPRGPVSQQLKPNLATVAVEHASTNQLHEIDAATQEVIMRVTDAQCAAAGGPAGIVPLGEDGASLRLTRTVTLPELRRHKRAFMKMATSVIQSSAPNARDAQRMFIEYLQDQIDQT